MRYTSEIMAYKENDITPAAQGLHIDRILVNKTNWLGTRLAMHISYIRAHVRTLVPFIAEAIAYTHHSASC